MSEDPPFINGDQESHEATQPDDTIESLRTNLELAEQALAAAETRATEAEERANRAEYDATHDFGTGALNKRGLAEAIRIFEQSGKKPTVIAADVKDFKALNDKLGHAAGDKFLREVAGILRTATRQGDIVARVGGDEFVVVMDANDRQEYYSDHEPKPLTPDERAEAVRQKIDGLMELHLLKNYEGIGVHISTGAGTADTYEDAFALADPAMYKHKGEQRGTLGNSREV